MSKCPKCAQTGNVASSYRSAEHSYDKFCCACGYMWNNGKEQEGIFIQSLGNIEFSVTVRRDMVQGNKIVLVAQKQEGKLYDFSREHPFLEGNDAVGVLAFEEWARDVERRLMRVGGAK